MEVVCEYAGGLDIGSKLVVATIRVPGDNGSGRRQETRSFEAFQDDLARLASWFKEEGITDVAMEATGVYWKPVWYALEDSGFELKLINPRQVKKVPGRKTDVKDAEWICQLLECGLLASSFVPPEAIRDLRDLTRYRKKLIEERGREVQRVQKVLEDAGIKLASVATDVLGVSGREMLEALIAGERSAEALAERSRAKMRNKIPELKRALATARFRDHHATMLRAHLDHIDHLDSAIESISREIDDVIAPFDRQQELLETIPTIGKKAAEVIISEIGVDMTKFPTSGHLASWAGLCPGNNESAGKHFSGRTRNGNPWLAATLVQCAWVASRTKNTYLGAQFWHVAKRRGRERAAVAVAHTILEIVWHILSNDLPYDELGNDWFERRKNPEIQKKRLMKQLEALGYDVTIESAA